MRKLAFAASLLACATVHASAADLPGTPLAEVEAGQWRAAVAAYLWGTGLSGTTRVGNLPEVDVDMTFGDILDNLDFAAYLSAEVGHGRWVGFSDLQFVRISIRERAGGVLADSLKLRTESLSWLLAGGYRVVDEERAFLDALVGGRLYSLSSRVSVTGGLLDNRVAEVTETWVDPVVGLKGNVRLTPKFSAVGFGFVGGFGAASDLSWDVFGGLGWRPRENISVILGYRASGVDYSTGDFKYDAIQHGPVIGGAIRF